MRKTISVSRCAGLILASAMVLFSAVSFTGCSNSSDDDFNNTLVQIISTRLSRIQGDWEHKVELLGSTTTVKYNLTSSELKSSQDGVGALMEGESVVYDFTDNNSGYIYFKYTRAQDPAQMKYTTEAPDVGKWVGIHFKELSDDGKSVKVVFPNKIGGKSSCESSAEAKTEFTVDNGCFADASYITLTK